MFKFSIISDEVSQDEKVVEFFMKEEGCKAIELRTIWGKYPHEFTEKEVTRLVDWVNTSGITISCLATPIFKCNISNQEEIDKDLKLIEFYSGLAKKLNVPIIRIFTFWRENSFHRYAEKVLENIELALSILDRDVLLGIENGSRTIISTAAELAFLFDNIKDQRLKVIWDPGNCIHGNTDLLPCPYGFYHIKDHVEVVHLKDPKRNRDGTSQYCEFGKGDLNMEAQIQDLIKFKFNGYISIETHYRENKVFTQNELDIPGGYDFSYNGWTPTTSSLKYVKNLIKNNLCKRGIEYEDNVSV